MKLLLVTAHPDDEIGSFAGTLLQCANRGFETYIVCLTPGQAATYRGGARSDDELAEMRRREFAEACKLLKVTRGVVLDYPDGKLEFANFREVVGVVTRFMREIRPQVVVTMGAEGAVTAHPDHSMVSMITTMAFHWAGRTNRYTEQLGGGLEAHRAQKLYHATSHFTLADRQPVSFAPATCIVDVGDIVETKIRVFAAHESQRPLLGMFEETIRRRGRIERFHLLATTMPREITVESDLFEGVVEEGSPVKS